jgi:hypothetical protein
VDPRTAKITLVMKDDTSTEIEVNPFDEAPVIDPARKNRKAKRPCM